MTWGRKHHDRERNDLPGLQQDWRKVHIAALDRGESVPLTIYPAYAISADEHDLCIFSIGQHEMFLDLTTPQELSPLRRSATTGARQ